jgi:hypothetical protein
MYRGAHRIAFALILLAAIGSRTALVEAQQKPSQPGATKDMYFMLLFSQERDRLAPRLSHTYAAFVHTRETKPGVRKVLETHTISWLPADLDVRLLRRPQTGVNLDLKKSLDLSMSLGTRISMWGPYQIRKELYDRAVRQETTLKQGKLLYKALDGGVRADGEGLNCFHAVADIDKDNGPLETGTAHGDEATQMVAQHLRRWIVDPTRTYEWVADLLGLKSYPITRRTLTGEAAAQK